MIGACNGGPVQLSMHPTAARVMGSTDCCSLGNLSVSSLFGPACLRRAQNLALGKPVSVRQAVSAFSSFSEGHSPYSREVGGGFFTNGEFCFKINRRALEKVDKNFLDATNQNTFSVTSAVSGKSKFYQVHNPNSCTWFIVNFGELWQVSVVTEKKTEHRKM